MAPHDRRIWVDGELVPWADATVHVLSHSFQRGTLVFDYMSLHDTDRGPAVFRMPEHLDRFASSCEMVGLDLDRHCDELAAAIRETVRANPSSHSVKISAYVPSIEVELVPQDPRVSVAIAVYDLWEDMVKANPGEFRIRRQYHLAIEDDDRQRGEEALPPQAKGASNYGPRLRAKMAARKAGYDDVVLLADDGSLAETPTTNLFVVDRAGVLRTPEERRVLHGVTRASLIEIARAEGFTCVEGALFPDDLFAASEAFLTATSMGVGAVVSVNGAPIGEGTIGLVSSHLLEALKKVWAGADPRFVHWLDFVDEA